MIIPPEYQAAMVLGVVLNDLFGFYCFNYVSDCDFILEFFGDRVICDLVGFLCDTCTYFFKLHSGRQYPIAVSRSTSP
jgi:hypothetical protein